MTTVFWVLGALVVLGALTSPFPHWPSYFYLWKSLARSSWPVSVKLRLAGYLIGAALRAPFFSLFWHLDELLYRGYHKCPVQPVFIIGQPRCGTTFLHRTLDLDTDAFFTVKHLEWRYPSITLQKFLALTRIRPLLLRSSYWPSSEYGKLAAKMHQNILSDAEEDGIFFEENFLHHFFMFLRFPDRDVLRRLTAFDELPLEMQQHMLLSHRKCIQKVAYMRGDRARIYLSKEVTSNDKIQSLLHLYPDARFIVAVRSAERFLPSLLALMQASTHSKIGLDPARLPDWEDTVVAHHRRQCEVLVHLCRDVIPANAQLRLSTMTLTREVVGTIDEIYRFLKIPMSEQLLDQLEETEAEQRNRESGYSYDPMEVTGFDEYNRFADEADQSLRSMLEYNREHRTVDLKARRQRA